jgi:hypothetical protein
VLHNRSALLSVRQGYVGVTAGRTGHDVDQLAHDVTCSTSTPSTIEINSKHHKSPDLRSVRRSDDWLLVFPAEIPRHRAAFFSGLSWERLQVCMDLVHASGGMSQNAVQMGLSRAGWEK